MSEINKEVLITQLKINPSDTITFKEVAHSRYRVNVYKSEFIDGSVVPRTTMSHSYYVEYNKETNLIKDLTI